MHRQVVVALLKCISIVFSLCRPQLQGLHVTDMGMLYLQPPTNPSSIIITHESRSAYKGFHANHLKSVFIGKFHTQSIPKDCLKVRIDP